MVEISNNKAYRGSPGQSDYMQIRIGLSIDISEVAKAFGSAAAL